MDAVSISARQDTVVQGGYNRLTWLKRLTVLAILGFFFGLYMGLSYAGTDANQGNVQRIFYFHVSAFAAATVSFFTAVIGGIAYLQTRDGKWDTLSYAGVEVGFTLSIITLITGMTWARPTWNTWWTWDPRLTSTAVMTLTYAAYLMLRNSIESLDRQRMFSAVYAILAITTVIFTFMITRIRPDTIHPTVVGPSATNSKGMFEMVENMRVAFMVNMMIWTVLIAPALVWWRVRLGNISELVAKKRIELMEL